MGWENRRHFLGIYQGEFQHVPPGVFVGTFNKNTYGSIYEASGYVCGVGRRDDTCKVSTHFVTCLGLGFKTSTEIA